MRAFISLCLLFAPLSAGEIEDAAPAEVAPLPAEAALETDESAAEAPLPDVARVGTMRITGREYQEALEFQLQLERMERGENVLPDAEFRWAVLEDTINGKILSILAKNAGIVVEDARVEEELQRGRNELTSEEAFQEYLAEAGLSEETLREGIRDRLRREAYIADRTKDVNVTDEQVREEYEIWLQEGLLERAEPTYDFAHIMARAQPGNEESFAAAEERLRAVWEQIREGADFEEIARAASEDPGSARRGGVYEEATLELVIPEIAERLQSMEPGVVSNPFRSQHGWHTMKVLQVNEPGTVSYEKIKDQLRERIEMVLRHERIAEFVAGARNILSIEIFPAAADVEPRPDPVTAGEP